MSIRRVALIYDDTVRPDTTGYYCLRALTSLTEVEHFRPSDLDRVPRRGFDLYLNIDDGLRYRLPSELRPSAWWMIDTHMDYSWYRTKGPDFDYAFTAQRDGAEWLRRDGLAEARWLPLACDPLTHRKHEISKRYDFCFVGNLAEGPRTDLIRLLAKHFPQCFIGQRYFDAMAEVYSATRVVFNRSVKNDVNMRVFEAVASGSLLLTNDLSDNGQDEIFCDGVHLATYRSPEELLDKLAYYLRRADVRERIANLGREAALAKHTYRHRMEEVLRLVATQASIRSAGISTHPPVPSVPSSPERFESPVSLPGRSTQEADRILLPAPEKDFDYYDYPRPEILRLIPASALRVLDIGCGAGTLGNSIKTRQGATVIGIELSERVAAIARQKIDRVIVGDVESAEFDMPPHSFDCVICADVLEHLVDPVELLRKIQHWLAADGCLIASIPNVQHHTIITSLLDGNWTYEQAGLLDDTHLGFYTRRDMEAMFHSAGYSICRIDAVYGPDDAPPSRGLQGGQLVIGPLTICGLPEEEDDAFFVYQYLLVAVPSRLPESRQRTVEAPPAEEDQRSRSVGTE